MRYNVLIGGAAGQGMDTISALFERILKKSGYYIYSTKDYMSRVRGGHNFIQIRFGEEEVTSHYPELDVIIALDNTTAESHIERLKENGVLICDEAVNIEDSRVLRVPMKKIAIEAGNPKVFGTAAVGALTELFGIEFNNIESLFSKKWDAKVVEANAKAYQKGRETSRKHFELPKGHEDKHIMINGNEAIALGAIAGGLDFYSAYPMTPATSIMTYLSKKQKQAGMIVEQVEDEISAINMALGASYAGARAATGSSGGGVSLMVEAIGLASITETPLLLVDSQRPGPATGLPTRTEQSDLSFLLTASHGEGPRMVLSVRNVKDAFYGTARALNLADKYQIPVILLTDQYLADTVVNVEEFDFDKIKIERHIAGKEALDEDGSYRRYKVTESGISPRLLPGKFESAVVLIDSDEHTENSQITESAEVRIAQMEKRMRKLEGLKEEALEPEYFGTEDPEILLLGWGSMYGPLKEAVELLNKENKSVGALVFGDLYPLPTKKLEKYTKIAKKIINVEQNFNGQLAKLIRMETGIGVTGSILKYDGRQLSSSEIYSRVKSEA
ncbi:2-oxoacid:acceptor oxidoreductase subunit alpha [Clostridium sp. YIM B02515]|uniref:2-oxoacid:acceptor oxidoreductase subunit alpha n=1 Tax=Clostridium rhizosphaerae TaxID=2803861 RepID=A0ABS1TFX0_9CLOT|nr:2-oxoacid:acceptor oxidoreductase subunit alpha [Clostridium rhizosphaerae]MBL4938279.1 2-oxoacid:acceptor oxidoreductase subunit alpha [Clostridium rhizosphaerae]